MAQMRAFELKIDFSEQLKCISLLRIAKPNGSLTFVKNSYSFGSVRSISKASGTGLKSSSLSFGVSAMTIHTQ